jgi:drug/metabolite transporter (DMT)-like permease
LRLTTSAIVLGLVDRIERRGQPAPPTPWLAVVGLGLLTSLLYQVLFISGIARTSATHAGFLISTSPLWTAAIARVSGLERIAGRAWIGLGLGFAGASVLVVARGGGGTATLTGNALMLVAMMTWALGAVLSRPVLAGLPATRLAFLFTSVALPGHWLIGARPLAALLHEPAGLGTSGWLAVLYSGALSTGLAYSLWNRSVLRIGPARTSAYTTNLVPLIALALAWLTLGERPGFLQLAGGALVLGGLAVWRSR